MDQSLSTLTDVHRDMLKLHYRPIFERILKHFKMSEHNSVSTPLLEGLELSCENGEEMENSTPYRQLIGARMHLANTVRPGVSFKVYYIARFMHKPNWDLWTAAKHFQRYLKRIKSFGILYLYGDEKNELQICSEAEWEHEKPSRTVIGGYVFIYSGGGILWR